MNMLADFKPLCENFSLTYVIHLPLPPHSWSNGVCHQIQLVSLYFGGTAGNSKLFT